jgi:NAD(P)-dependent dehydrogenase (short-subunit alcohol dehydrogenase family)
MKENNGIRFSKYFKEYQWSNVNAMLKNNRKPPLICEEKFTDKLVVITGATSGIGKLTAHKYASMGAQLLCINRNLHKSEILKHEIESQHNVTCDYFIADFSNLTDTHAAADHLAALDTPIDVIIHNAGNYLTKRELNAEGIEKIFMVHYLSSFIINYKLASKLKQQESARIILVNSEGHRFAAWGLRLDDLNWEKRRYSGLKSYGSAKLAQLLSMHTFTEYYQGSNVCINAMHPGAVKTDTGQENGKLYKWYKKNILDKRLKPASISADALYYLGVSKDLNKDNGIFYNLTTKEEPAPPAWDKEIAKRLWDISIEMGKLS